MSLKNLLFGEPLATHEEGEQRVGPLAGIPMLGLDALASAAYGPEAAMTLLIPLGALGVGFIGPISILIIALLFIVYLSYRQTIGAYPTGGGLTVARRNLGVFPGLLAAAALLLDYVLVVAVGISAGVGALVSALPNLQPYSLWLCLGFCFSSLWSTCAACGIRRGLHRPDLSVRILSLHGSRHRHCQIAAERWPPGASRRAARAFNRDGYGEPMASAAGFFERLHRDDRR